uniref:EF-hand domain-containing protein n=1 Tax=Chaetoceros debilis TaxID=122233 RepID=A0A7S3PTY2_9STRA|mmetsp:Transcript_11073/g.16773  ORF Transcript_11073/g.16773 Transcript_11073/m.16773 type:complete len:723 (+) Transcript_11073:56-2224(+)
MIQKLRAANNAQTTAMLFFLTLLIAFGHCNADSSSTGNGEEDFLIVHVTYDEIYKVLVFLIAIFVTGLFAQRMGMPSLVGEIFIGFLLGPPLANVVPYEKALVLIGEIGLIALILQAGIELDVAQLRTTGTRAMAIALTGSVLPVGCGFGIAKAFGYSFKAALAIGASFAPTSSGVVASVLGGGGMLNTSVGQLIIAACVVDDIVGLLLLSMFQVLVKEDAMLMEYFFPLISSFGFLLLLGIPAVTFLPRLIQTKFLPKFPESSRSLALFGLLTAMLMAYLPLMSYTKSSYLTGAFLAGATFSQIDGAYDKFKEHTSSIMEWLLRVFFAATIGFQVPLKEFSSPKVILLGLLLWVTCVAIKFPVAMYVPRFEIVEKDSIYNSYKRDTLVTGIAMTCRGEFSFVIAAFALSQGVIALDTYASIVFAVLLSAISSPFLLLRCIKYFNVKEEERLAERNPMKETGNGTMALRYLIKLETKNAWSLLERIQQEVNDLDLVIEDISTNHARGVDPVIRTEVQARDKRKSIAISTIEKEQKMQEERETSIRLSLYDKLRDLSVTELSVKQYDPWSWAAALDRIVQLQLGNDQVASEKFFYSIFEKADIEDSGFVNGDELFSVLTKVGMDITREGINAMIEHVDIDGDGRISYFEWEKYVDKYFDAKNGVKKSKLRDLDTTLRTDSVDFGYSHDEERADISFPISFSIRSKSQSSNSLESIFEAVDEDV